MATVRVASAHELIDPLSDRLAQVTQPETPEQQIPVPGPMPPGDDEGQPEEPPTTPSEAPPRTPPRTPSPFTFGQFLWASPSSSLASVPAMFGDGLFRGGTLVATEGLTGGGSMTLVTDVPLAGGTRRLKIAEHNKAVPVDRVYFNYNHFHNALRTEVSGFSDVRVPPGAFAAGRIASLDRFTLGLEKTFFQRRTSIELRLPLAGRYAFRFDTGAVPSEPAAVIGEDLGNLSVIFKQLIYNNGCTVVSAGLGIDTPTGDDALAMTAYSLYSIENDAVYLSPYLALLRAADSPWFFNGFLQLDVPLNGNEVNFTALPPVSPLDGTAGRLVDQILLNIDLGTGCWLYSNQCAPLVTGLAAIVEVHSTTTLNGVNTVASDRETPFGAGSTLDYRSGPGQLSVVNLTAGLHTELRNLTTARIAGVVPLSTAYDRIFAAEVIAQFSRQF